MKNLYLALCAKIADTAAITADEVSDKLIKHIDRYNAQPDFMEGNIAFHLPAVFIEFPQIRWETLSGNVQRGQAIIRLHLVQYTLGDSSTNAYGEELNEKTDALRIWDTLDELHKAVQGFGGGDNNFCWAELQRTGTFSDIKHNILSVDVIEYSTVLTDATAAATLIVAPLPPLKIEGEPVRNLSPNPPYLPGANDYKI